MTEREREREREMMRELREEWTNRRVARGWWWLLQPTPLFDIQFLFFSSFSFLLLSSLPLLIFLPFFSFSLSPFFLSLSVENLMSSWEKKGRIKIVYFVPYNQECGKSKERKEKEERTKKEKEERTKKEKEVTEKKGRRKERKNLSWNFFINN